MATSDRRVRLIGELRSRRLRNGVPPCRLAKPLRAELRRAFLSLVVHVDQPEAVAKAVDPFEVVLSAPQEIPTHRYAISGRALQLCEVRAQEHDPVGVVHLA